MPFKDPEVARQYRRDRAQQPDVITRRREMAKAAYAKNRDANPEYQNAWKRADAKKNPDRHRARRRRAVGIIDAPGEIRTGACENAGCTYVGPLHCDHDHATGLFRGWLCRGCNHALGNLKDSPAAILGLAQYLER